MMKTFNKSAIGLDIYNYQTTGDKAVALTANSCSSCTHTGPALIVLNDQGGGVMSVQDIAATLRAQDHWHPPVICFEPGIAKREGNESRFVEDMCGTLRAEMGDNQPAVCYAIDHVVTTGGNCTAQGPCYYENICPTEKASGVHAICYRR